MSEDFQVGDVVVAVAEDECPFHSHYPDDDPDMIGKTYRIVAKTPAPDFERGCCGYIHLGETGEWCSGMFRKLPRADESFTETIRACKPQRNRVPA